MAKQNDDRPIEHYEVNVQPNGFIVAHPQRRSIYVSLEESHLWRIHWDNKWNDQFVEVLNFPDLIEHVANALMYDWRSPVPAAKQKWWGAKDWVKGRVARALNHRVHKIWLDTVEHRYEPWQLALMRRVFSVTYAHIPSTQLKQFFDDHPRESTNYLIKDVMQYRAAAHALMIYSRHNGGAYIEWGIFDWRSQFDAWFPADHNLPTSRWKTLMAIPHAMSNHLLSYYKFVPSPRPITTKRQLAWICAMSMVKSNRNVPRGWSYFPKYASDEDLGRAVATYSRHQANMGPGMDRDATQISSPDQCKSYIVLADYVSDSFLMDRETMRGCTTVNALIKRGIEVHRTGRERNTARSLEDQGYTVDTLTAKPPIEPPESTIQGGVIRFLETVGDLQQEGNDMSHCVGSYASYAVDGISYLFHVTYKGDHATVEVSPDGLVRQAHGTFNKNNKAVIYGKRILSNWGRRFPHDPVTAPHKELMIGNHGELGRPPGLFIDQHVRARDHPNYAALPQVVEIDNDPPSLHEQTMNAIDHLHEE